MRSVSSRFRAGIRHLVIIAALLALAGCSSERGSGTAKPSTSAANEEDDPFTRGGRTDLGGGRTLTSSPQLVRETIALAQQMASEPTWQKNVFKLWLKSVRGGEEQIAMNLTLLFPKYSEENFWKHEVYSESPVLSAIAKKKIKLIDEGDCPKPDHEPIADASVSQHNLNGELCFSVGNLTKHSPADLTRQVLALLLHEAVHLGTGDEKQAQLYQNHFDVFFRSQFPSAGESYLLQVAQPLRAALAFDALRSKKMTGPESAFMYAGFGEVSGALKHIEGILDPLKLQVRLAIKNPHTITKFVEGLRELLKTMDDELSLNFVPDGSRPKTFNETQTLLVRLEKRGEEIQHLWTAIEKEALCNEDGSWRIVTHSEEYGLTCSPGRLDFTKHLERWRLKKEERLRKRVN